MLSVSNPIISLYSHRYCMPLPKPMPCHFPTMHLGQLSCENEATARCQPVGRTCKGRQAHHIKVHGAAARRRTSCRSPSASFCQLLGQLLKTFIILSASFRVSTRTLKPLSAGLYLRSIRGIAVVSARNTAVQAHAGANRAAHVNLRARCFVGCRA